MLRASFAFAFGDKTNPPNGLGAYTFGLNAGIDGAVSVNNAFVGTRYFALSGNFPMNSYYLFFFQWTVRRRGSCEFLHHHDDLQLSSGLPEPPFVPAWRPPAA